MDESAIKGLELLELNGRDADADTRSVRRICVEGYDTSLPKYDLDAALRKHFSSCGEMIHVYVPTEVESGILNRFALIYVLGKGAEEKALSLSGTQLGGRIVVAKAYPFEETHLDLELARMRAAETRQRTLGVTGYDTSLEVDNAKRMLINHFSSCGRVLDVSLLPDKRCSHHRLHSKALVYMMGEDAIEKALKLSGRDVGGLKIDVIRVPAPRTGIRCGYIHPRNLANLPAEQKDLLNGTIPSKLLIKLTTAFREGGLRDRSGEFYYKDHLSKTCVPVLALAGDWDLICPPAAVEGRGQLYAPFDRNLCKHTLSHSVTIAVAKPWSCLLRPVNQKKRLLFKDSIQAPKK